MGTLHENIVTLCEERGIKPGKMCNETGISRGLITDLKMGRKSNITIETAQKIAEYFGVTVDRVLGNEPPEQQKKPTLPEEGELDASLIGRLIQLTPEEMAKVDAFVQGLLAAR